MRRILGYEEVARKEKRNRRVGGIVIISLLILSTLGFALSNVGTNDNSNASEDGFFYNGQYWVYTVGAQKYYFTHHPDELNASSQFMSKNLADFSNKQIYVDSEINGGFQEIYGPLGSYSSKISEACYGSCEKDLPEKNCDGVDEMIVLRESLSERIREEGSCTFIEGSIKTVDSFLYKILGIN